MSEATALRAEIAALLLEYGEEIILTRSVPGSYDTSTGQVGTPVETEYEGRGRIGHYHDRVVDGSRMLQTDRWMLFQPTDDDVVPQEGDMIESSTAETYTVVSLRTRALDGDWIAYNLQLR